MEIKVIKWSIKMDVKKLSLLSFFLVITSQLFSAQPPELVPNAMGKIKVNGIQMSVVEAQTLFEKLQKESAEQKKLEKKLKKELLQKRALVLDEGKIKEFINSLKRNRKFKFPELSFLANFLKVFYNTIRFTTFITMANQSQPDSLEAINVSAYKTIIDYGISDPKRIAELFNNEYKYESIHKILEEVPYYKGYWTIPKIKKMLNVFYTQSESKELAYRGYYKTLYESSLAIVARKIANNSINKIFSSLDVRVLSSKVGSEFDFLKEHYSLILDLYSIFNFEDLVADNIWAVELYQALYGYFLRNKPLFLDLPADPLFPSLKFVLPPTIDQLPILKKKPGESAEHKKASSGGKSKKLSKLQTEKDLEELLASFDEIDARKTTGNKKKKKKGGGKKAHKKAASASSASPESLRDGSPQSVDSGRGSTSSASVEDSRGDSPQSVDSGRGSISPDSLKGAAAAAAAPEEQDFSSILLDVRDDDVDESVFAHHKVLPVKLEKRVLEWFKNPPVGGAGGMDRHVALRRQGYFVPGSFRNRLLGQIGAERIVENHRLPRVLDTIVLNFPFTPVVEQSDGNFKASLPGYREKIGPSSSVKEFGIFEFVYELEDGVRRVFHRFFRPVANPGELMRSFVLSQDDLTSLLAAQDFSTEVADEGWSTPAEEEGWQFDDAVAGLIRIFNPTLPTSYGILLVE